MVDDERVPVESSWRELLPSGLRVLLFAEAVDPSGPLGAALDGVRLRPLGLVALRDELRPDAGDVLEALAAQGVRFKIISGDNPITVREMVRHLNLPLANEPVVTGVELENADDPDQLIRERSVFGRVAPAQKLQIIDSLQSQGLRVSMLGDGINDILAIKRSDLGIAMGAGSSATKTVAGLVLENNNFALLPMTWNEGRTILRNLQRAAKLFLLKNVYTLFLIVILLGVSGFEFPYLPQQVTLLNMLTIGGPALLIVLSRRPDGSVIAGGSGLLREAGWFAIACGTVMGMAGLAAWMAAGWWPDVDVTLRRTMLLSTLILVGLGNVMLVSEGERRLVVWAGAALPIYLGVMHIPATNYFFALRVLAMGQWLLVVGLASAAFGLCFLASGRLTRMRHWPQPARRPLSC